MKLKGILIETFMGIIPIVAVISLLQFTVAPVEMELYIKFLVGTVFVVIGLMFFLMGIELGFSKIGEGIGSALVKTGKLRMILLFTAILGFVVTLLEPDVQVFSVQADRLISSINGNDFTMIVAWGIGIFISLAFLRLFVKIPIKYLVLIVYTIAFVIVYFCPKDIASVAFDVSGATTGALTTPFVLSLAMGVTSMISKKESTTSGFGILGIASMGPILLVLIMGVLTK